MSKTTVAIQKIKQDLDSISGLDGIVGDWVVWLSEKIHKDVLDILNNYPEASLLNYCGNQYCTDSVGNDDTCECWEGKS